MSNRLSRGFVAALMLVTVLAPFSNVAKAADSESTSPISFSGQLIELSSTTAPTTIVVRKDPAGEFTDYTVDIDTSTKFGTNAINTTVMDDWITGDGMSVVGTLNNNTGVVTATTVVDASLNPQNMRGLNGWISSIGTNSISVQWQGAEHNVNVISTTHMVVGSTNPAAITDFKVGDRVRIRLDKGTENARIIVVLRRGDEIFLKARTRGFWAEVTDIDESGTSGSIDATLLANPHLRDGDANNMVGTEGDAIKIDYDENTKLVRKFMGTSDISEFAIGDKLFVVGRVNDDGTISARLIKDGSMWKKGVAKHVGVIHSVDTSANTFTVTALDGGSSATTVTVSYSGDTVFMESGVAKTESILSAGLEVRVRGIARNDAGAISITDVDSVMIIPVGPHGGHGGSSSGSSSSGSSGSPSSSDTSDSSDESDSSDSSDSSDGETSSNTLADLVVSDIELSDDNLVVATLENTGETDVTVPVSVNFYFDGALTWTYSSSTLSDQSFLQGGESSTVTPQSIASTTTVKVCVDEGSAASESREDNNCLEKVLTVGSTLPNLTVTDLSVSDSGQVTATLKNTGSTDVTVPVAVDFYLNGTKTWTYSSSTLSDKSFLEAGEDSTISPQAISTSTTVKVCVDSGSAVTESSETDNCLEEVLQLEDES
ncbi:MAG: CARDB domain-containing protein [Candidatus Uhrbacteria bacterium]